jgi:hypothetical protein
MDGGERLGRCLFITDSGDTEQKEEQEQEQEVKSFNRNTIQSKELPQQAVNYDTLLKLARSFKDKITDCVPSFTPTLTVNSVSITGLPRLQFQRKD